MSEAERVNPPLIGIFYDPMAGRFSPDLEEVTKELPKKRFQSGHYRRPRQYSEGDKSHALAQVAQDLERLLERIQQH